MNKRSGDRSATALFAFFWFAYSATYIGRLNYSACMPAIMAELHLSKAFAGAVGTGFLAFYAVGQLLNGLIGDKISPKYMIGAGLFGAGAANLFMGFNTFVPLMPVIWCFNGYCSAMLWSPLIRAISEWLPQHRQTRAGVGIASTIPAGTIASYLSSALILRLAGWRAVFLFSGGFLILASAVWAAGMAGLRKYIAAACAQSEADRNARREQAAAAGRKETLRSALKLFVGSGLAFAAFGILFNGVLKDGVTLWVPAFLKEYFGVSPAFASVLSVALPVASVFGAYLSVGLNKRFFDNEFTTSAVMFLISAVSFTLLILLGVKNIYAAVLMIAASSTAMLGLNTMFLTFIPLYFKQLGKSATVTGFLNACSYAASSVSSVTIGVLAARGGWNATILSWVCIAAAGLLICVAGRKRWAENRGLISRSIEEENPQTV